jgi:hypothetical protein
MAGGGSGVEEPGIVVSREVEAARDYCPTAVFSWAIRRVICSSEHGEKFYFIPVDSKNFRYTFAF